MSGTVESSAVLSADEVYRYELRRIWDDTLPRCAWIMLNPSTADHEHDDPTIRRCMAFARAWGYGAIVVRNLFALRATKPRELLTHPDPVGPENDEYLRAGVTWDDLVMCAWGTHGAIRDRGPRLLERYTECGAVLHTFGLTQGGHPRHPLYVPSATTPTRWEVEQ